MYSNMAHAALPKNDSLAMSLPHEVPESPYEVSKIEC
jgi:hypothetical protein